MFKLSFYPSIVITALLQTPPTGGLNFETLTVILATVG